MLIPTPSLGLPHVAGCPDCGLFQRLPPHPPPGGTASCLRCDAVLRRHRRDPFGAPLALACAALCLYVVAVSLPLLDIDLRGRVTSTTLASLPLGFDRFGYQALAVVTAATILLLPFLRIAALTIVLQYVLSRTRFGSRLRVLGHGRQVSERVAAMSCRFPRIR